MQGAYCYLPILPARDGAFRAVASLSSIARSRLTPLLYIPAPTANDQNALDAYLAKCAQGPRAGPADAAWRAANRVRYRIYSAISVWNRLG